MGPNQPLINVHTWDKIYDRKLHTKRNSARYLARQKRLAWQHKYTCSNFNRYGHRHNVIGIIKAHYNILKTRSSNVNCGKINAIAMGPTDA